VKIRICTTLLRALFASLVLGTTVAAPLAEAHSVTYELDIPSQSLNDALQAFALASNHELLYSSELVEGKHSPSVKGRFTTEQAMSILLSGTKLKYEVTSDRLVLIRNADSPTSFQLPTPASTGLDDKHREVRKSSSEEFRLAQVDQGKSSSNLPVGNQSTSQAAQGLEEIVVTAERREEGIQQTPVSVTAITGETLQNFGMKDFADYARSVPDLSFGLGGSPYGGSGYGFSSTREIIIRGVSGGNTTSLYIDDTPIPSVIDPRVLDVDRIEVLRGPQGTLFGASSMGGTVRFITRSPDLKEAGGRIDAQTYDINAGGAGYDVSGTANLPILPDTGALRVSGFYRYDPSYFNRIYGVPVIPGVAFQPGQQVVGSTKFGATKEYGASASMLFSPEAISGLTITPIAILQHQSTDGYPLAENNPGNFTLLRPLNIPEGTGDEWQFYALAVKYAASFGDIISSTSFLHRYATDIEDGTLVLAAFQQFIYSPLPYVPSPAWQTYDTKETTQELRFQPHVGEHFDVMTGLFYQRSNLIYNYANPTPGANALSGGYLGSDLQERDWGWSKAEQSAAFADVTYRPTTALELSAGVRKARLTTGSIHETVLYPALHGDATFAFTSRDTPLTPRYVAKYSFDADNVLYASASKGFRTGGSHQPEIGNACAADTLALGFPPGAPIDFHSDSLWSYELGSKSMWDARRVSLRVAAYRIDWQNIQQTLQLPCGTGVLTNAGAARINGGEAELSARVTGALQLSAGAGYEYARITEAKSLVAGGTVVGFPVGSPLSNVPKWTGSARAEYVVPTRIGESFIRGEYSFVGRSLSLANGGTGLFRDEYSLVDLRSGLRTDAWTFTLFAKNLLNKAANYGDVVTTVGLYPGQSRLLIAQPRTIGLEIERRLGSWK
jgi:iron complex outermembrane receptor protein